MPILTGSLVRIVLGIWTDRFGGRLVYTATMLAAAVATFLLAFATTYAQMLLAALGVGLAGGSFAVGVAYVSRFYPGRQAGHGARHLRRRQCRRGGHQIRRALRAAGLGLAGCRADLGGGARPSWPSSSGSRTEDDPVIRERRIHGGQPSAASGSEFAPLKDIRVWRFALYYFFAFGAFVALALWLPRYLIGVYGFDIATAGMIGAAYSIPASIFRAYGGVLSDRIGARTVLYWTFAVSAVATRSCRCRRPTMPCAASTGRSASTSRSGRSPSSPSPSCSASS